MRCSLLTLSTYLDGELAPDRAGEVEAHLVACQRCSSGLGYLREEKGHVSSLAMVHADAGAAEDLLGAVGLALLPAPVMSPPEPAPQFLLDLAESPRPSSVPPPPDESGNYLELNGSPSHVAATEKPAATAVEMSAPVDQSQEPDAQARSDTGAAEPVDVMPAEAFDARTDDDLDAAPHDVDALLHDEQVTEVAPPITPAPPAPPQWSQSYAREPSRAQPRDSAPSVQSPAPAMPNPDLLVPQFLADTAAGNLAPGNTAPGKTAAETTAPEMVPPHPTPKPASPSAALTGRASSWLDRARDAVSVRWALMRGPQSDDIDDDSIQIVSGTGAPERRSSRANRTARDASTPSVAAAADVAPAFAPIDDDTPDSSFAPPEHEPLQRPAFTARERLAARAAMEKLEAEGVLARDEPVSQGAMQPKPLADTANEPPRRSFSFDIQEPVAPPGEFPRPLPRDDDAAEPGRHQRLLHGDGSRFKLPSFSIPRPSRPAGSRQAPARQAPSSQAPWRPSGVATPLNDRRLWIFGAVVVVAGLIGLLVGKSVTPATHTIAPGTVPNPTAIALPSAHASAVPTPAATPRPTPQPTATPAPTPAVANPNALTGAQNLGAGGAGFTVQDIRYGAHPGDYRIVFDLSGSGSPTTTVGFGNSTTLYVIFTGASGPATVAQPAAGNTATAVKLLQPSPISGKTIYEFTLSGPAKLSTMYLQSPVRLVIDLS